MSIIESITAAASRILTRKGGKSSGGKGNGWQPVALDLAEEVPEVGQYAEWMANASSKVTLFAGKRGPDGEIIPAPAGSRPAELVAAIAGGPDGQAQLLSDFAWNLSVTGEAWLIIIPDKDADTFNGDRWEVLSVEEAIPQRGKLKATIDGVDMEIAEYDPDNPPAADEPAYMRVYRPSKRRKQEATSPVRSSIVVLEELRLLNAAVAAVARSRITGRGVLLVPSGTRFPATPGQEQAEDSLLDTFIEVASTAIREPESAAATVPILLEIPGDRINGVKWLDFGVGFDTMLIQLRDEAIRRFAAGVNVPAEQLLGVGGMNHWGAWAVSAEAISTGVEPTVAIPCNALTTEWLQPILDAEGDPEAGEWLVWYDSSGLRTSSNKAAAALEAFKEGLISDEAARREIGFTEADKPSTAPVQPLPEEAPMSLPVDQIQQPPTTQPGVDLAAAAVPLSLPAYGPLVDAVDGLVWAALTSSGHKQRLTSSVPRPARADARELDPAHVHVVHSVGSSEAIDAWRLLDGVWSRVPEVAARHGLDPVTLTAALDKYVRALLVAGQPHVYANVPRLLAQTDLAARVAA